MPVRQRSKEPRRMGERAAPDGVSEEGPKPVGGRNRFLRKAEADAKPEYLEGDRKERRGGTGEPNSRYGSRRDTPRGRKTS